MNTKQLLNEWRSFLKESTSEVDDVEIKGTKLTVYHLTGVEKIEKNIVKVKTTPVPVSFKYDASTSNRASNILRNLKKGGRSRQLADKKSSASIEFNAVRDILGDPYTKGTGFIPGGGDMYGKALYTCYKFNPNIARVYGDLCLKFEVDINNYLIFFEDLAKQIHGEDWRVEDQVKKILKAKGYNFDDAFDKSDINQNSLHTLIKKILVNCSVQTREIINKSYLNDADMTSGAALRFAKLAGKNNMRILFDGIIFRGKRDGPVCVIYDPINDAKLTKIGRINTIGEESKVSWSNSLREFFGDLANLTPDVDFQTMNAIGEENYTDDDSNNVNYEYEYDEELYDLDEFTLEILRLNSDKTDVYYEENLKRAILDGFSYLNKNPTYYLKTTSAKKFIDAFIKTSDTINLYDPVIKHVFVKLLDVDKYKNDIEFCKNLAQRLYEPYSMYDVWSYTHAPAENEVQMKLARHPSTTVRKALLNNPDLNSKVLEFLTDDKDEEISSTAKSKVRS